MTSTLDQETDTAGIADSAQLKKRSLTINGHSTSISLEEPFWKELRRIADEQKRSIAKLVGEVDEARDGNNLSSALRVYVLKSLVKDHLREVTAAPAPSLPAGPGTT